MADSADKKEPEKRKALPIIKNENISSDIDDSLDCYGNFDKREKNTCGKCGMAEQCSKVTKQIKDKDINYRPIIKSDIDKYKESLSSKEKTRNVISGLKKQEETLEKKMKSEKKVLKKKSSESEGSEKSTKKVLKVKSEKSSGEEKKKKVGRPSSDKVETIKDTTIPTAFKSLYKFASEIGSFDNKGSVSNVRVNDKVVFCFPVSGRSAEKVDVFLNRSAGYSGIKEGGGTHVGVRTEKKSGSIILSVAPSEKSQSEASEILKKWVKDSKSHKVERKEKDGSESKGGEKKLKKKSGEEKSEKKTLKVKGKDSDSSDKKPPVIKPKKVAPRVEEDEEG